MDIFAQEEDRVLGCDPIQLRHGGPMVAKEFLSLPAEADDPTASWQLPRAIEQSIAKIIETFAPEQIEISLPLGGLYQVQVAVAKPRQQRPPAQFDTPQPSSTDDA
jgi:hypothetical protein